MVISAGDARCVSPSSLPCPDGLHQPSSLTFLSPLSHLVEAANVLSVERGAANAEEPIVVGRRDFCLGSLSWTAARN